MAEINTTQMRDALAWLTNDQKKADDPSTNPFEWFWEAIQGDFNEDRSTGQLVMDAAISMIPLVDQVCDARDLIANCVKLRKDVTDGWAWVSLGLTLIGLFPFVGSLVKGVLKIFFAFVRRMGGAAILKAVDLAMTWVITFLRRRDVQKYLRLHKIDDVFNWLAKEIRSIRGRINVAALLNAFDRGIKVLEGMVDKVAYVPLIGKKARGYLEDVQKVRLAANDYLADQLKPLFDIFDRIALRLDRAALENMPGIVNVKNVHFRGTLPEAAAVRLMGEPNPLPEWMSKGKTGNYPALKYDRYKDYVAKQVAKGWPPLNQNNIESFANILKGEISGPARLYRILSPNSRAMSDCWVTEEVFNALKAAENPRAAWRRHLAVWPDWNVNGQFVVYDVKPGETLKVWRGKASSQFKKSLPDRHLEGGWEQIIFKLDYSDARNDTMRFYKLNGGKKNRLEGAISQGEYYKLPKDEQARYVSIRESINHPNISGPFETGWRYEDFDGAGLVDRIGLPALPGQTTKLAD
ncbi:hypothetical protein IP92_04499 [Pseudoduganella flava]|uniref:Uncharacterized protein n=1 Tax=Pseudoduganella flava TaxID=871742 RepID=A0A562PHR2_9BURK|nr:hypothetical protein [Pseudoduganella flava]QGZ37656.1 hypothetical protein GO485_00355 [Pseudoduganella flava]TWI43981.1 hypothetical protein IP92_04499 [Pseudoduganella flava]